MVAHPMKEEDQDRSDLSGSPPFKMAEVRAAIPKHCWVKSPWRSLSYVAMDVTFVLALAMAAARLDLWAVWSVYWAVQGTMFWAIFVLGHECGHGSFSDYPTLNSVVGHLLHSPILVPYNGWRISHRKHHNNHGHVDNDESWTPLPETLYKEMGDLAKFFRFSFPFLLLAFPVYLWRRSPGKHGSHFDPDSEIFDPSERRGATVSALCCYLVMALLLCAGFVFGPGWVMKIYGVPYLIFILWLDFVTYMHHHGSDSKLPWYRGKEWSYLRGALTTTDQDYGLINKVHHDIGTHVIHHLFPQIPHYHLVEATEAAKPVLGKYYREPVKAMAFPFHLLGIMARSLQRDHYVGNDGDVVFYKTDIDRKKL